MYTYSYVVQPEQMLKVRITSYCCRTSNCVECEKFREMKEITGMLYLYNAITMWPVLTQAKTNRDAKTASISKKVL